MIGIWLIIDQIFISIQEIDYGGTWENNAFHTSMREAEIYL
jgi:hypothetical protein